MYFPFPFDGDTYAYSNNLRRLENRSAFEITDTYLEEISLKRQRLLDFHQDCFQQMPSTSSAQWEVVQYVIQELTHHYPHLFSMFEKGKETIFVNHQLNESESFQFGVDASIPWAPLDFIGRHVQEDLILMGQRDDALYLDAGQLCFPGNWSIAFDIGMKFADIHRPVPVLTTSGLGSRIEQFILRMRTETAWTRLNWSLNAGRRLDTAPSSFHEWGSLRQQVTKQNAGELVYLRVEEQNLMRLPGHNSILFTIHSYLMAIQEVIQQPLWRQRLTTVLCTLSEDMVEYKGLCTYLPVVLEYLQEAQARA